jgi:hypothetical protein
VEITDPANDRFGNSISVSEALPIFLLGLVQGHQEIKSEVAFIGDVLGSGKVPVDAGIAVVFPFRRFMTS